MGKEGKGHSLSEIDPENMKGVQTKVKTGNEDEPKEEVWLRRQEGWKFEGYNVRRVGGKDSSELEGSRPVSNAASGRDGQAVVCRGKDCETGRQRSGGSSGLDADGEVGSFDRHGSAKSAGDGESIAKGAGLGEDFGGTWWRSG